MHNLRQYLRRTRSVIPQLRRHREHTIRLHRHRQLTQIAVIHHPAPRSHLKRPLLLHRRTMHKIRVPHHLQPSQPHGDQPRPHTKKQRHISKPYPPYRSGQRLPWRLIHSIPASSFELYIPLLNHLHPGSVRLRQHRGIRIAALRPHHLPWLRLIQPKLPRNPINPARLSQLRLRQSKLPVLFTKLLHLDLLRFNVVPNFDRRKVLPHIDHHQHKQHTHHRSKRAHLTPPLRIIRLHNAAVVDVLGKENLRRRSAPRTPLRLIQLTVPRRQRLRTVLRFHPRAHHLHLLSNHRRSCHRTPHFLLPAQKFNLGEISYYSPKIRTGPGSLWRKGLVLQSCLSPERRWDNPGPITCTSNLV